MAAGRFLIRTFSSGTARSSSLLGAAADASASVRAGLAPRYINTFSCAPAAAKTRWLTTETYLSRTARSPTIAEHAANLNRTTFTIMGLATCTALMLMGIFDPKPSDDRRHSHSQKKDSHRHCPTCSCKSPARGDSKS